MATSHFFQRFMILHDAYRLQYFSVKQANINLK